MTAIKAETNTSVVGFPRTQHPSSKEYSLGESHVGTDAIKGTLSLQGWKPTSPHSPLAADPAAPLGKLCKDTDHELHLQFRPGNDLSL